MAEEAAFDYYYGDESNQFSSYRIPRELVTGDRFKRLFEEVVRQCIVAGFASGRLVGTDSTHVKANASLASEQLVELPDAPGVYWGRLDIYEEAALETLVEKTGKWRAKRVKQIKKDSRHKRVSRTDPESGHMKRPGKPEGPHYLAHQTVDEQKIRFYVRPQTAYPTTKVAFGRELFRYDAAHNLIHAQIGHFVNSSKMRLLRSLIGRSHAE